MPLGFPALANLAADRGFDVRILHLGIEKEYDSSFSLKAAIDHYQPKIVLLSLHWHLQSRAIIDTARAIRSWKKDIVIVLGGLSASTFALEIVQSIRSIDAVVIGDGEEPLLRLLHCIRNNSSDFSSVPNLVWRSTTNTVIQNPRTFSLTQEYSAQLRHGSLALLDHSAAYLERALYADFSEGAEGSEGYAKAAYLNAGRGCTADCIHCGGAAESQLLTSSRSGVILYPLDKLMRDIREAQDHGANLLRMSFDPPLARTHLLSWFERIRKEAPQLRTVFDFWFLPTDKMLESLAETFPAGSTAIISPECGNEDLRYRIRGLPFKNDKLLAALRAADDLGIRTHCFFSAGLPTESLSDLEDTAHLIEEIRKQTRSAISVCPMTLDPASPLFLHPDQWNTKLIRRSFRDFYEEKGLPDGPGYETATFSEEQILSACSKLLSTAIVGTAACDKESPVIPPAKAPRKALLIGAFRSILPEGQDSPFGSQGGFVDTLAPQPYSLANAYLKAFAESDPEIARHWQIDLLNFSEPLAIEDSREEFYFSNDDIDRIILAAPDLIGFSVYCWNLDAILAALPKLHKNLPSCTIVLGGRSADASPHELLEQHPSISALLLGEAELAFAELLRRNLSSFDNIPGLTYRSNARIVPAPPKESISDLDQIPSPYLQGILDPPPNAVMMELCRGCLHGCGYCTWNADKCLRFFSPQRTHQLVRWALEKGHRHITIIDSAINYQPQALADHVDAIRAADPQGLIHFTYNIRHDCLTDQSLNALAKLPTHMLLFGIETLNPPAMGSVDRNPVNLPALKETLAQIASRIRPPVVSIVLGLPGDTEQGFRYTLDTLLSWTDDHVNGVPLVGTVLVSLLQIYPGSKLWQKRKSLGLLFEQHGIPYLLSSPDWLKDALVRCKSYLLELIHKNADKIKAAEAIVLLESQGGLLPCFAPNRLDLLLSEWPQGKSFAGWTYEKRGLQRDTGQALILRFRHINGTIMRVRLTPKSSVISGNRTRYYDVEFRTQSTAPEFKTLQKLVHATLARGEQKLLARAEAQRIRSRKD